MPVLLTDADGTVSALHVYYQRNTIDGRTIINSQGGIEHADGTVDTFTLIDPQLRFQDDNRRLLGGSIHVRLPDGTARTYVLEVPTATGFHLGTGLYFGFEGKYHGQWRGALDVSGEHVDDCADPTVARRLHQHRDCVVHLRDDSTGTTGWGNAQTIVIGAFPDLGLTAEQSFV
jgi:hypothetical protein